METRGSLPEKDKHPGSKIHMHANNRRKHPKMLHMNGLQQVHCLRFQSSAVSPGVSPRTTLRNTTQQP
jgi:hypothetical protein